MKVNLCKKQQQNQTKQNKTNKITEGNKSYVLRDYVMDKISSDQTVRHVLSHDLYLTRLALVPLCLHTVHSVRTSSGFFVFAEASVSFFTGRRPLFGGADSELDSNFGFY